MERGTRQREGEVEEEEGSPNHETIIMAKGQIRREREREDVGAWVASLDRRNPCRTLPNHGLFALPRPTEKLVKGPAIISVNTAPKQPLRQRPKHIFTSTCLFSRSAVHR